MKTWVRRTLWGLGLVLGLPLLLGLLWLLLNVRDVAPQPWPQALALPGNTLPAERNAHALLQGAPLQGELRLERCEPGDCLAAWRAQLPELARQRAANAAFGAVCEAVTARTDLRYEDPLPERLSVDSPFAPGWALTACHNLLLGLALEAVDRGDAVAARAHLARADRLDRAVLGGARSLIAQLIGSALFGRKLLVVQAFAQAQPGEASSLLPLAAFDAAEQLARQRAWIQVEANFQRAVTDSLRGGRCGLTEQASTGERWLCRLAGPALQPEYLTQLMTGHWVDALALLQAAPSVSAALPALRERLGPGPSASAWQRVRHTLPHALDDVTRPATWTYFEREADLQLATEATRLWLLNPAKDWAAQASPALRERLAWADGSWRLTPWSEGSVGRMPLAWRTPT